jgi:hypothetical protein
MKKIIFAFAAIALFSPLFSQEKVKFGSVSEEDVKSTVYKNDTAAPAVVLYESMDSRFDFNQTTGFEIINYYFVRIKILTNNGLEYANQSIYTYKGQSFSESESISGLAGYTYNYEDGEVVKTKLTKDNIFEEKVSEHRIKTKFSFPNVKPGSVIEFKYQLKTPDYSSLKDFSFQREIPVQYSRYEVQIPEYFLYNREVKGYEYIKVTESRQNKSLTISGTDNVTFSANNIIFETSNLPALKDDAYVWNVRDYMTRVTFELKGVNFPNSVMKTYTSSWSNVDEELLKYQYFGQQFKHKYFKEELSSVLKPEMSNYEKIRAIYSMVKSKVKWNEENTLIAKDPKEALKNGLGTSGEINALLICALNEAGYNSYPVVMSLRERGRIPLTHPTIDYLNYFIAAAEYDGKVAYMDASAKYGDVNVLPSSCITDMARSVRSDKKSDWVDLTGVVKSATNIVIAFSFDNNGSATGSITELYTGLDRYRMRSKYNNAKSENEYIEKLENDNNFKISDFKIEGDNENSTECKINFNFIKEVTSGGDHIYFNPLLVPVIGENPFKAEKRKLPVEFSYPYDLTVTASISLPDGYIVEELPKPGTVKMPDGQNSYSYMIAYNEAAKLITVRFKISVNRILYSSSDYAVIRNFYTYLVAANTAQIVLKKI